MEFNRHFAVAPRVGALLASRNSPAPRLRMRFVSGGGAYADPWGFVNAGDRPDIGALNSAATPGASSPTAGETSATAGPAAGTTTGALSAANAPQATNYADSSIGKLGGAIVGTAVPGAGIVASLGLNEIDALNTNAALEAQGYPSLGALAGLQGAAYGLASLGGLAPGMAHALGLNTVNEQAISDINANPQGAPDPYSSQADLDAALASVGIGTTEQLSADQTGVNASAADALGAAPGTAPGASLADVASSFGMSVEGQTAANNTDQSTATDATSAGNTNTGNTNTGSTDNASTDSNQGGDTGAGGGGDASGGGDSGDGGGGGGGDRGGDAGGGGDGGGDGGGGGGGDARGGAVKRMAHRAVGGSMDSSDFRTLVSPTAPVMDAIRRHHAKGGHAKSAHKGLNLTIVLPQPGALSQGAPQLTRGPLTRAAGGRVGFDAGGSTENAATQAYFAANPDVAAAYAANSANLGMTPDQYATFHYDTFGVNEGRGAPAADLASPPAWSTPAGASSQPAPAISAPAAASGGGVTAADQAYLNANSDVAAAIAAGNTGGMTPDQYVQYHYQTYGVNEGRGAPSADLASPPAWSKPAGASSQPAPAAASGGGGSTVSPAMLAYLAAYPDANVPNFNDYFSSTVPADVLAANLGTSATPKAPASSAATAPNWSPTGTLAAPGGLSGQALANTESAYLQANPDVLKAYNANQANLGGMTADQYALQHYDLYGQKEGRLFTVPAGSGTYPTATPAPGGGAPPVITTPVATPPPGTHPPGQTPPPGGTAPPWQYTPPGGTASSGQYAPPQYVVPGPYSASQRGNNAAAVTQALGSVYGQPAWYGADIGTGALNSAAQTPNTIPSNYGGQPGSTWSGGQAPSWASWTPGPTSQGNIGPYFTAQARGGPIRGRR